MNQLIKQDTIDLSALIKNNNTTLSINGQSKTLELIREQFTEKEVQWYIVNLYLYMHYHPTNDFPINLEDACKIAGFAHKKNAKRTLLNNFSEDTDYKLTLLRTEQRKNEGGFNEETIMLNIDTFKNLCMITKSEESKKVRQYYIKLENIHNQVIKEELQEKNKLIEEKDILLIEQKEEIIKKDAKIKKIEKYKIHKYDKKERIYIAEDSKVNRCVIGTSKDLTTRESNYLTHNPDFEIKYNIACRNYILIETIIKKIMVKYLVNERTKEWFNCSCKQLKNIIEVIVYLIDDTVNQNDEFENVYNIFSQIHNIIFTTNNTMKLINTTNISIDSIKVKKIINNYFNEDIYKQFVLECCEINDGYKETGKNLLLEFKKYLQETELKNNINQLYNEVGYTYSYGFIEAFKKEFYDNIQLILNTKLVEFKVDNKYYSGFKTIRIKSNIILKDVNDDEIYDNFLTQNIVYTNDRKDKIKTSNIIDKFNDYITQNNIVLKYTKDNRKNLNYNHEFRQYLVTKIETKYNIIEHKRLLFNKENKNRHYGFYGIWLK